jgi:LysR family transcriptional regulator, transcriptional activator for leuABCD operon
MFNLRNFDLNLLVAFEAIHETGSITRAAGRLGLTQPAVSHALGRMREHLGDELFTRAGSRLVPTAVAAALAPAVAVALEGLRVSLAEARGFVPAESRRAFHIAIPHPAGPFIALELRRTAAGMAPFVRLDFDTRSTPVGLEEALRDGSTDLAVDWLPAESDACVNRRLYDETLVVLARHGHPRIRAGATLAALRAEEFVWIRPRRTEAGRPRAFRQVAEAGIPVSMMVSELLEVPALVAASDMLGVFPRSMAGRLAATLRLVAVDLPLKLVPLPVQLVWHEGRRADAGHRWLRELVSGVLGRR